MSDDDRLVFIPNGGDRLTNDDQSKWMATCNLDGCTWRGEIVATAEECDHTFGLHLADKHPRDELVGVKLTNPTPGESL